MKILRKGTDNETWWVGLKVKCRKCGWMAQLEKKDLDSALFIPKPEMVIVGCLNCAGKFRVMREFKDQEAK